MATVFSRLLLATEHTEFDRGAEAVAFALAQRCGLPLSGVLPIVSNPEYEALAPQIVERADQQAGVRLRALAAEAGQAGVRLTMTARRGPEPFEEIVAEAREQAADLLIIRRRGQRGLLANLLVGEMVSKVVAHAACSVLVTPRDARIWTQAVLAAVDPQAPDARVARLAAAVARDCGLPLGLVAVIAREAGQARRDADEALHQAVEAARAEGVAAQAQVRIGRAHEQILAAAGESLAGLIVMGRHGDTRLGRAWVGGVTQKVIGLADRPVLVAVFSSPKEAR